MKSIGVVLGLAVGASGCVTYVEATRLNHAPRPMVARPAESVEIYASSPPTRPHVDVALLRADQSNWDTDTSRMVQALAKRAGELGCDALFLSGASERAGAPGKGYAIDPGSRILLGTCIAYVPQPTATGLTIASVAPAQNAIQLIPPPAPENKGTTPVRLNVLNSGDARR